MSKKDINLKYAKQNSAFFSGLSFIKGAVAKTMPIQPFNEADDYEIGRAGSYAIFPELKEVEKITVENLRQALSTRGIVDESYQNKILHMLLQNRAGIQFRLGSNIMKVISGRGEGLFTLDENYGVEIKVIDKNSVDLIYTAKVNEKDPWKAEEVSKAFDATVRINISPEKVLIKDCKFSKVLDNKNTNMAFQLIQGEQQNILMKLLSYIRHALGFDSELRIDKPQEEKNTVSLKI